MADTHIVSMQTLSVTSSVCMFCLVYFRVFPFMYNCMICVVMPLKVVLQKNNNMKLPSLIHFLSLICPFIFDQVEIIEIWTISRENLAVFEFFKLLIPNNYKQNI